MILNCSPIQQDITTVFTKEQQQGYLCGISELDEILCGFCNKRLYVVGAAPSVGKSSLLTDIAIYISKTIPVVFFSLEMSFEDLQKRILCNIANVNYYRIIKEKQFDKIESAFPIISQMNLLIDDKTKTIYSDDFLRYKGTIPKDSINTQIQYHVKNGVKVFVIDYLQLIRFGSWTEREDLRVHQITWQLHTLAKEYDICIILASQINRESRKDGKRPQLSALRDAGQIEQDADIVMFIHRPEYYKQPVFDATKDYTEDNAELIIAKNRHGPTSKVIVEWHGYCMSFRSKKKDVF